MGQDNHSRHDGAAGAAGPGLTDAEPIRVVEPDSAEAEAVDIPQDGDDLSIGGPGQDLAAARVAAGLSLEDVAERTRIPLRHLESIERNEFSALPGRTYAVGFTRTYAKALGLDANRYTAAVRDELALHEPTRPQRQTFDPGDPERVPSRGLAWFGAFAALLLLAGLFAFYRTMVAPGAGPGSILPGSENITSPEREDSEVEAKPPAPAGPVVFTSTMDDSWVRFYEADGEVLLEKQMAKGERFTLPAAAQSPLIRTGRPYAFDITVGGQRVAPLSRETEIISDVPVDAASLLRTDRGDPKAAPDPDADWPAR